MQDTVLEQFVARVSAQGITLSNRQLEQFELYYKELVEWNERMNLTAITEREQVYLKHFYDSLTLAFHVNLDQVATMADIGAGAGFPSIPLKIAFPHLKLTIVDSLNKRIHFLNHLVERLELQDVKAIHARAEEAGRNKELRDRFDLVTARAVARLSILNELCLPLVRPDGIFAAMKSAQTSDELQEAKRSIELLKGKLEKVFTFTLPVEEAERNIVVLRKMDVTPAKYPRKPGTPGKDPL
ncbi:16S rRNA (guanine(527)-N(7))-methyltransferase RsmG [Paenibacillus sp. YN15]|uniref:16S rRNA (guanine(527)-N(7))-methyltransferase RsmG n=1 Tax=Paenibacillus sp. YN15 TaxID=1742774 RepID=UPI000DCB7DEA|nr:16S rRNA (guanine(527)-N(7))-methyltransferase RsmG [Paenibacillus sp. YN15]RAU91798.1 16S rRNA (guanine(527)-N(7))-methyltransferase RsmG [Paenibacillus sp. YN15]